MRRSPNATAWVVWCGLWALVWVTIGWLVFPYNLPLFVVSLGLMLLELDD